MLKACWDCLGDQRQATNDSYSVHLNGAGGTQGPPWQPLNNSNMFPTPTLRAKNQIIIKGQMVDRRLTLGLLSGNNTTVCQIDVANRPNETENFLHISSYGNVVYKSEADTWFNDDIQYLFRLEVNNNGSLIHIYAGIEEGEADQYLESVAVDVNSLRSISANGEVEKLIFIFK